jgi:hypothetical protein
MARNEAHVYEDHFLGTNLRNLGSLNFRDRDLAMEVLRNAIDYAQLQWVTTTLLPFLSEQLNNPDPEVRRRVEQLHAKASNRVLGRDLDGPIARQRWGTEYALSMIAEEE